MSRLLKGVALVFVVGSTPTTALAQLKAFPSAEGFGALASGGRGGSVYHVTNLNDTGAGSFRDAVSQSNRTVVFDVGGVINIASQIAFSNNLTVAGQTAPGGIAVYGNGISLSNRSNIIIRGITFRSSIATSDTIKGVNMTSANTIMLDHLSIAWARYDNFGITKNSGAPESHDITMQSCMIYEAINNQRAGGIVDSSRNLTFARNLFSNNDTRNPKGKGDLQYINNVIYNYGKGGYVGGHSSAPWYQDLINNYFIAGPSQSGDYLTDFGSNDMVYHSGNKIDDDKIDTGGDGLPEGRNIDTNKFNNIGATVMPTPYNNPTVPVTILPLMDAFKWTVAKAGNALHRDSADQRQINDLKSLGTLGYIPADETQVGGMPAWTGGVAPTDADSDGMPDWFEQASGLNPNNAADMNLTTLSPIGYTNLEVYINSLMAPVDPVTLVGDYNANGAVDAADFQIWRKNLGTSNLLANDAIGGTIGSAQYDQWRAHFGQTSGGGAAAGQFVPEPLGWTLMLLGVTLLASQSCVARRARRRGACGDAK